jgi:GNAT superfamily N-acetyltransferase
MATSIRPARLTDGDSIAQLALQLGYDVPAAGLEPRLAHILSRADQQFLVADVDGRVVGWLHAAVFEFVETDAFVVIAGLVVDREHRRKGIGRMLMAEAEGWARGEGYSIVRLWSSASRAAAHRFYEELGYTKIKTQFAFAKSLNDRDADLGRFVPHVES